ncbi:hypothetical protein [uncultured Mucilaginibacter sp.]|nr:hypothetical protein [uncultured Mucilaginibacter sp.]
MELFAEDVSDGYAFHLVFNWWEIALFTLVIVLVIYFIRKRRIK